MSLRPTSFPRFCRSEAGSECGQALVLALLLILLALPVGVVVCKYVNAVFLSSMAERRQKTAAQIANSALTDYMRQFSQDAYNGHYDPASLDRGEDFYSAGFSSITYVADEVNRTVYVRARGHYGSADNIQASKTLEALVQFQSDLTQYGTMVNGNFTISASNVSYDGGMWINGDLRVTGSNVRFNGGPLVVQGDLTGASSVVLDGDLYYSGTDDGDVTILGASHNYVPATTWPALDMSYYDAHYTYKTTVDRSVVFNADGTFTVVGDGTHAIPPKGAIIYAEDANLEVSGAVNGRVTVVAGGSPGSCSSSKGKVTVEDNLYYAGASSVTANASGSFAALASNCIRFDKSGQDLLVVGVFFVENGTSNMRLSGSSGRRFWLYGVRTQGISVSPGSSFNGGRYLTYDARLRAYPPPGLPEKALLVGWNLR